MWASRGVVKILCGATPEWDKQRDTFDFILERIEEDPRLVSPTDQKNVLTC